VSGSVLQFVAVFKCHRSIYITARYECVAMRCSVQMSMMYVCHAYIWVCCSMLQYIAVCGSVLQCSNVIHVYTSRQDVRVLQCVAVCSQVINIYTSRLDIVHRAYMWVCWSVLQCVAVSTYHWCMSTYHWCIYITPRYESVIFALGSLQTRPISHKHTTCAYTHTRTRTHTRTHVHVNVYVCTEGS